MVDPAPGLGYHQSLLSQVSRKMTELPHFQGLVVDRSDWNQAVNFQVARARQEGEAERARQEEEAARAFVRAAEAERRG